MRGRCTTATHSAPARYLVAWHQDKNPQDGSCGTDCPQAQPGNGHVFTHSLTHPLTHSLTRSLTRVSPGPTPATLRGPPAAQAYPRSPFTRRLTGRVPPWCRRQIRAPPWQDLRGRAPSWHCPAVTPVQWRSAIVVPPACTCAIVARLTHRYAIAVPPLGPRDTSTVAEHQRGAANARVRRRGAD